MVVSIAMKQQVMGIIFLTYKEVFRKRLETISKPPSGLICHSEQSEESRISDELKSLTPFRMTKNVAVMNIHSPCRSEVNLLLQYLDRPRS